MNPDRSDIATLAGGCFWCLEAVYQQLRGVDRVVSGYMGGTVDHPSYEQVCTGTTGHAEVVQVHYQPATIGYGDLLDVFFTIHDPTTLNRQGPDRGTQYRSAIFYHDPSQRDTATATVARLTESQVWPDPIITEITAVSSFYPAETHHQDYYANHASQPYCVAVVAPKVAKARAAFLDRLK